jgi:hypothetical protein
MVQPATTNADTSQIPARVGKTKAGRFRDAPAGVVGMLASAMEGSFCGQSEERNGFPRMQP